MLDEEGSTEDGGGDSSGLRLSPAAESELDNSKRDRRSWPAPPTIPVPSHLDPQLLAQLTPSRTTSPPSLVFPRRSRTTPARSESGGRLPGLCCCLESHLASTPSSGHFPFGMSGDRHYLTTTRRLCPLHPPAVSHRPGQSALSKNPQLLPGVIPRHCSSPRRGVSAPAVQTNSSCAALADLQFALWLYCLGLAGGC